MPRIAIVTNELPPYRIPFFERLARVSGVCSRVFFCSRREPNRQWELPSLNFDHVFLTEQVITLGGRYIHNNPDVVARLRCFSPDVVVTGGFNPTHLYAFCYARAKGIAHVPLTDGTYDSERSLSRVHKMIRRLVYARSTAFVAASRGGQRLYESYGISAARCFRACLCVDNAAFSPDFCRIEDKRFDFIFCGRLEPLKNPLFAVDVAVASARRLGRKTRILFVGTGSQGGDVKSAVTAASAWVEADFRGFVSHDDLPSLYQSASVLLFPTLWDSWGVVVNEACAAGLPVLVSPYAGAAGELVRDNENGFVCDLDVNLWAERATLLLTLQSAWAEFSARSISLVSDYTYEHAVQGLLAACNFSLSVGAMNALRA